jgi:hypothetical protein
MNHPMAVEIQHHSGAIEELTTTHFYAKLPLASYTLSD